MAHMEALPRSEAPASPGLAPVMQPAEVADAMKHTPGLRLLDVRTPGEYAGEHIRGSYNVPLDTLGEHTTEIRARVDDPVVLVCQSGQRARKAEDVLKASGMKNLHVLDRGVSGWTAAGLPVVRGTKKLSLERQVRIAAGVLAATGGLIAVLVESALRPAVGLRRRWTGLCRDHRHLRHGDAAGPTAIQPAGDLRRGGDGSCLVRRTGIGRSATEQHRTGSGVPAL